MPITINNELFYTKEEVDTLIEEANTTVANQWEEYELTLNDGLTVGWDSNKFFVNKHTGAVTGMLGITGLTYLDSDNRIIGENSNLAIHSKMDIKYPGQQIYTVTSTSNSKTSVSARNANILIREDGFFRLQGEPFIQNDTTNYIKAHIESFFYIGSKYGKIVDKEPYLVYLSQGAFYNQDSVDLLTGKAWLRQSITNISGYTGYVTYYKNLWSGEIIFQYSLRPSTAGTFPSIPKPKRFAPNADKSIHQKIRYTDLLTTNTDVRVSLSSNFIINQEDAATNFGVPPHSTCNWITGSNFWIGRPEVALGNRKEATGLWRPENDKPIYSMNASIYDSLITNQPRAIEKINLNNNICDGYSEFATSDAEYSGSIIISSRTGMIFNYVDLKLTQDSFSAVVLKNFTNRWKAYEKYRTDQKNKFYYMGLIYTSKTPFTITSINEDGTYSGNLSNGLYTTNMCENMTAEESGTYNHGWGTHSGISSETGVRFVLSGYFLNTT